MFKEEKEFLRKGTEPDTFVLTDIGSEKAEELLASERGPFTL